MMQLIFFAVSVLILLLGHFLAWLAIIRFFNVTTFEGRIITASLIIFIFISILISSFLIHKWDNLFTRWYYIFSAFWIGVLVNFGLMLFVVLIWKLIGPTLGLAPSVMQIKLFLIIGSIILSSFGLFNAFVPKVKDYEVKIKDLPLAWHNKKIIQISDVHLGPVYRKNFFSRVINKINSLEPEAVFITGDLFDGMEADFTWMNHPFSKLETKKGIYYVFGNHDLYLGFNYVHELLKESPVIILDNKMVTKDGLQLIGINYSFNQDFNLHEAILEQVGYSENLPSILLFHEPKHIESAIKAGIDLQLSGHTHRGQLFPFNWLANMIYKGHGYGLFQKDTFSLITNSGLGTWGPPMRTSSRSEIVRIILRPW